MLLYSLFEIILGIWSNQLSKEAVCIVYGGFGGLVKLNLADDAVFVDEVQGYGGSWGVEFVLDLYYVNFWHQFEKFVGLDHLFGVVYDYSSANHVCYQEWGFFNLLWYSIQIGFNTATNLETNGCELILQRSLEHPVEGQSVLVNQGCHPKHVYAQALRFPVDYQVY